MRDVHQHLALDVHRAIAGFVSYADIPRGSLVFYGLLNDATETAKNVVYVLQTLVGDSIVVRILSLLSCSRQLISFRRCQRSGDAMSFGAEVGM